MLALFVYAIGGYLSPQKYYRYAIWGVLSILIVWFAWIFYVDWNIGQVGAYWEVREIGSVPRYQGSLTLLHRAAFAVANNAFGEWLRYFTALQLPLMNMWILSILPLKSEVHRYSIFACILSMLFITFFINNPNKIIVYTTTFPGHFATSIIFLNQAFSYPRSENILQSPFFLWRFFGYLYILICLAYFVFYILGTPLAWYY